MRLSATGLESFAERVHRIQCLQADGPSAFSYQYPAFVACYNKDLKGRTSLSTRAEAEACPGGASQTRILQPMLHTTGAQILHDFRLWGSEAKVGSKPKQLSSQQGVGFGVEVFWATSSCPKPRLKLQSRLSQVLVQNPSQPETNERPIKAPVNRWEGNSLNGTTRPVIS